MSRRRLLIVALPITLERERSERFRVNLPELRMPAASLSGSTERDALSAAQAHVKAWFEPSIEPEPDGKTAAAGRDS